ncbi:CDC45-like protein [Ascodesmis nigricans]|uniref:CDC45-like protein n=1 Tax=Ascodesmis nigricans TaxID=341454 RepID=A0A4S2N417_9PEZI|nr:CDC45-like protein [Ascodesmis nigricans]
MYIPRSLFSSAYAHLKANAHFATSSILILCALDTDSICATRILTSLLKRDYIQYQIKPIAGYQDLERVNVSLIRGNEALRFVICLGLGGLIDISAFLDLGDAGGETEVECWIIDGRRPWNLENIYGGGKGDDDPSVRGGAVEGGRHGVGEGIGGIKCFDDGDIADDMGKQAEAFKALMEMPEMDDDSDSSDDDDDNQDSEDEEAGGGVHLVLDSEDGSSQTNGKKRKSSEEPDESDDEDGSHSRARRQRRDSDASSGASTSSTPIVNRHTILSHGMNRPLASSSPPINSDIGSPTPQLPAPRQLSTKQLRRKLRRLRQKHTTAISAYYAQGTWYGEPVSSLLYALASDLGREDNDILWLSIVGVCSGETYGRTISSGPPRAIAGNWIVDTREEQVLAILRDEVRRLNPPDITTPPNQNQSTALQTTAKSPNDTAIRISPEFRFMMIRHWSLYDAMLHSSYLGTKLHIWSEHGKKRLHKLLAKMGFSLAQCKQSYTHMDMDLKRSLKEKLERYAPLYGLDGIVKAGFVRCWGWRGCLSAADVGYIIGGILEVGRRGELGTSGHGLSAAAMAAAIKAGNMEAREISEEEVRRQEDLEVEEFVENFWTAFDALEDIEALKSHLPTALLLHRAILRTGTALIEKRQIKPLRAFRLAVVREGPDLPIFTHPNALTKLSIWLSEAIMEQERERGAGGGSRGAKHLPLVVASLNERRDVYTIVGTALGAQVEAMRRIVRRKGREIRKKEREEKKKRLLEEEGLDPLEGDEDDEDGEKKKKKKEEGDEEDSEEDSDDDDEDDEELMKGGRNRFSIAFQEVANSTQARIRIDSFEATVVEVKKEDLAGFLESLSFKSVVG